MTNVNRTIMGLKERRAHWDEQGTAGWVLWVVFFIYSALMSAFIQLVLPYLIPQIHLGHGLFVLDSTGFHKVAAQQAAEMMEKGWSAWQLRPEGHFPAGIASVFYYLWDPEPYSLIPFNAVQHATAGYLVYVLLSSFMRNRWTAACGASLFVLNPASMEWVAQIHRDGTFILGILMVLTAWLTILKTAKDHKWQGFLLSLLLNGLGLLCLLVSRPYWIQIALLACLILYIIILLSWIPFLIRNYRHAPYHIAAVFLGCLMLTMQILFMQKASSFTERSASMETLQGYSDAQRVAQGPGQSLGDLSTEEQLLLERPLRGPSEQQQVVRKKLSPFNNPWVFSPFIPHYIEMKLYGLSVSRTGVSHSGGKTLIDSEFKLISARSYLIYLPRAVQIGFLSPFPNLWTGTGSTPAMTLARNIMGIVTCFFYVCLAFFIWSLWANRMSLEFWLIVFYSVLGVLVFTYAYPNVGSLVRFRYGFFMVIVAIGFAFAVQKIIELRQKAKAVLILKNAP